MSSEGDSAKVSGTSGKPRSRRWWLGGILGLILVAGAVAAAVWVGIDTLSFAPFQLTLYASPSTARAGGTTWRCEGALVLDSGDDRLVLRAWAPSFSLATDGPPRSRVRVKVRNVLPSAGLGTSPALAENRKGLVRLVEVPAGSGPVRLEWKAAPQGSFTFAVTGDIRGKTGNLPAMARDVDFVVIAGDVVGDGAEFPPVIKRLGRLPVPVYTVVGNHDVEGSLERDYVRGLSPYNYAFTYGAVRLLFFDNASQVVLDSQNRSMQWLESELAGRADPGLTFLFMHRPPFQEATVTRMDRRNPVSPPALAARLLGLLPREGVDAVFCGHIHEYHRWQRDGIPYVISGEGKEGVAGPPRYARVRVEGSGFVVTDETVGPAVDPAESAPAPAQ